MFTFRAIAVVAFSRRMRCLDFAHVYYESAFILLFAETAVSSESRFGAAPVYLESLHFRVKGIGSFLFVYFLRNS